MEKAEDARGHFARTFSAREFSRHGLNPVLVQSSLSFNKVRGTLRGLHWQAPPYQEDKLVRVTRGRLWDVLVDIRPQSPTFRRWHGEELSADSGTMLYIPAGFAHGFVTLLDETEVLYQISAFYEPSSARGARFDDPAFAIRWPEAGNRILSERDAGFPPFEAGPSGA